MWTTEVHSLYSAFRNLTVLDNTYDSFGTQEVHWSKNLCYQSNPANFKVGTKRLVLRCPGSKVFSLQYKDQVISCIISWQVTQVIVLTNMPTFLITAQTGSTWCVGHDFTMLSYRMLQLLNANRHHLWAPTCEKYATVLATQTHAAILRTHP